MLVVIVKCVILLLATGALSLCCAILYNEYKLKRSKGFQFEFKLSAMGKRELTYLRNRIDKTLAFMED